MGRIWLESKKHRAVLLLEYEEVVGIDWQWQVERPTPEKLSQHLCLDRGYDYQSCRESARRWLDHHRFLVGFFAN
ncbi:hypothetical protein [Limnofasciculus baicalensis]|uniref:Uncharacterized protein n=1 Tax=Limnofasciculus baicalensis BBK-W-15 TaxID=2699891 RepID=A0AAE3GYC2_9CYAN|nr:hypothetical protein [Limnofasciculus baicalensis]MCP2732066.1 hypothetical protein [Limnofasciculus baicalensis BBK-W-15]